MALVPSHPAVRTAIALMTGSVFLLAGCGSDGTVSSQDAVPTASPTATTDPVDPVDPDTATTPDAAASPAPEVRPPEETADSDGAATTATEEPAEDLVITIVDFAYQLPDTVPPGSTVTVVNEDTAAHTVTSSGAFEVNLTGGQTGTFTAPEQPGEYKIICLFHGNMTATLVVG